MAFVVYLNVTSGIQPETKKIYMSDKQVTPFINMNNYRVIILSDQYNVSSGCYSNASVGGREPATVYISEPT